MARTVPGTGADIEPIFDEVFGVRAVRVVNGGSGYTQADPPRLTVTGCLKMDAVCRIGGTKFASFLKLFVKSYGVLAVPLGFFPTLPEKCLPLVVANAEFIFPV